MNKSSNFLILISGFLILNLACTGGRQRFSSDYYCFDPAEGQLYDPIPLEFTDIKYRKAVFAIKVPTELLKPSLEPSEVEEFLIKEFGGAQPDINDRIREIKNDKALAKEKLRKELSKVLPIEEGVYEYVGGEIFTSQFLPQITASNKYRRIHVLHQKNAKSGELSFNNKCVSNMPTNTSLAPITTEALTGFKVESGVVTSEAVGEYHIAFEDLKLKIDYKNVNVNEKSGGILNPSEYLQKPGLKYQLYKLVDKSTSAFAYELRSHIKQGEMDIFVRTLFKLKTPAKKTENPPEDKLNDKIDKLDEVSEPQNS